MLFSFQNTLVTESLYIGSPNGGLEEDKTTNMKIFYYGWEHPIQDALV